MNTDLIVTLRTVLTHFVPVVWRQKQFNFFLHCCYYYSIRLKLFHELCEIDMNLPNLSEEKFVNIILYGSSLFSDSQNRSILNSTIKYITDSNRFSGSIF